MFSRHSGSASHEEAGAEFNVGQVRISQLPIEIGGPKTGLDC